MSREVGSGIKAMQGKLGLLAIEFYSLIIAVDRRYASDTASHLGWPALQQFLTSKEKMRLILTSGLVTKGIYFIQSHAANIKSLSPFTVNRVGWPCSIKPS